jgi:tetratricopeptide (TPR) repeat protein
MAAHIGVRQARTSGQHLNKRNLLLKIPLLVLLVSFAAGCLERVPRVKVSSEDLLRSNVASQEGDIAFSRKDFYAALIKYLEATRLNPNNALVYNRLGITYSQLRFYPDAIQAFRRSMKLNSKYSYSVNNLGSVYFAQKQLKKAEKYFKKAISMKPDEASFHMNLGSLYFEKKKVDQAMAEWRKGMALDPESLSKNAAVNLSSSSRSKEKDYFIARIYAAAGNAAKAIEHLKQAIEEGFTDIELVQTQPDFDPIRNDEQFIAFLKDASIVIKLRANESTPAETPFPKR